MAELDLSRVTRVEVIDARGRSYMRYNQKDVQLSLQDEGQTLKVFTSDIVLEPKHG